MFRWSLISASLALLATTAHAQYPDLPAGTHVRVGRAGQRDIIGRLVAQRADTMIITTDNDSRVVRLRWSAVRHLQVGHKVRGGRAVPLTAAAGSLFGGIGGALVGPLVTTGACRSEHTMSNMLDCSVALFDGDARRDAAVVGALGGAAIGAVVGALSRWERWDKVPLVAPAAPVVPLVAGGI